jgi:hypothetical protein
MRKRNAMRKRVDVTRVARVTIREDVSGGQSITARSQLNGVKEIARYGSTSGESHVVKTTVIGCGQLVDVRDDVCLDFPEDRSCQNHIQFLIRAAMRADGNMLKFLGWNGSKCEFRDGGVDGRLIVPISGPHEQIRKLIGECREYVIVHQTWQVVGRNGEYRIPNSNDYKKMSKADVSV